MPLDGDENGFRIAILFREGVFPESYIGILASDEGGRNFRESVSIFAFATVAARFETGVPVFGRIFRKRNDSFA